MTSEGSCLRMRQKGARRQDWAVCRDVKASVLPEVLRDNADSGHSKNGVDPVRELHDRRLGDRQRELFSNPRKLVLVHAGGSLNAALRSSSRVNVADEVRNHRHTLDEKMSSSLTSKMGFQ